MSDTKLLLSQYINIMHSANRLLLYRDEEELSFLKEWMSEEIVPQKTSAYESAIEQTIPDNDIQNCTLCGRVKNRKPGWGTGQNGIIIIINTPLNISSAERDELRQESGDLLNRMISAINLNLKECYVTNLIKCEPESSVNTPGMMLKNCAPKLVREVDDYSPKIGIIMGDDTPLKRLMNQYKNIAWYRIDHPIKILKNPALKKSAWITLKQIIADMKKS
ncbi:MAG: hypothetical protein JW864_03705 [Spirochaetes bacterium]|nr:hypothetical protein [Spirochaetota bacterium]